MHLFALPNLSAPIVSKSEPWINDPSIPEEMSKGEFIKWINDPSTQHCFVSGFEGLAPTMRCNDTNPVHQMHALIADFDAVHDLPEILTAIEQRGLANLKPQLVQRTVSGHVRAIWFLESPTMIPPVLVKETLKALVKELQVAKLMAGLDENILRATQYYCWSGPTTKVSDDVIPSSMVINCIIRATESTRKYVGDGPVEVPLNIVAAEVQKQFPGRWTGDFVERSRGVCFWDATAKNSSAAVVTPTGMLAFSQALPFYTWEKIFGPAFVRDYEQAKLAGPLEDLHFVSDKYWSKNYEDRWLGENADQIKDRLMGKYGLSSKPPSEREPSEVRNAMMQIRDLNSVEGLIPALYDPKPVVYRNGNRYLNISQIKAASPAEGTYGWGENFPFLAHVYDSMFLDATALPYLLAWMKRFYESSLDGALQQGQAIFMAGPAKKGKTVWGTVILSALMGGSEDASDYLTNKSTFNSEIMHSPIWNVDDESSNNNWESKVRWTSMIKKAVANTSHPYHPKYQNALTISWSGRVVVTLNDDPVSMEQIPELGASILDKLMLFHANGPMVSFPPNGELHDTVIRETPFFARWVLDWVVPEDVAADNRFGVQCYYGVELVEHAQASAPINGFSEIIDMFADLEHAHDSSEVEWRGNATALFVAMSQHETMQGVIREYSNSRKLGHALRQLSVRTGSRVTPGPKIHNSISWVIQLTEGKRVPLAEAISQTNQN